jgi:hypothetical protein
MLKGHRILLRPIRDNDWQSFEEWGKTRDARRDIAMFSILRHEVGANDASTV